MIAYAHPDENLLDDATITVQSGTPLDGYDVERLNNGSWAYPFKVAETALELRFAFDGPVLPEFVILGNTNLTVAATLYGSAAAGGSDVSHVFAVPTLAVDGVYTSPFADLSDLAAKQYWRLVITGNATPIIIGELFLGSSYRTLDTDYELDQVTQLGSAYRSVDHETAFGVEHSYPQDSRREDIDGSIVVTLAEFLDVAAWHQSCRGRARPTWMVPDLSVNDAWLVRLTNERLARSPYGPGGWRVLFPVRQLSRGLAW